MNARSLTSINWKYRGTFRESACDAFVQRVEQIAAVQECHRRDRGLKRGLDSIVRRWRVRAWGWIRHGRWDLTLRDGGSKLGVDCGTQIPRLGIAWIDTRAKQRVFVGTGDHQAGKAERTCIGRAAVDRVDPPECRCRWSVHPDQLCWRSAGTSCRSHCLH
jgi:hypothetical protein